MPTIEKLKSTKLNETFDIRDKDAQEKIEDLTKKVNEELSTNISNVEDKANDAIERIEKIEKVVPTQASENNTLADKAFVNSSIQTATASFRGVFDTWADVPDQVTEGWPNGYVESHGDFTPNNNDYIIIRDASGWSTPYNPSPDVGKTFPGTWRFKYANVSWAGNGKSGWFPEYQLNDTVFTSTQLAALNSGIAASMIPEGTTGANPLVNKTQLDEAAGGLQEAVEELDKKVDANTDDIEGLKDRVGETETNITNIKTVIPAGANANNKLVDANTVNNAIGQKMDKPSTSSDLAAVVLLAGQPSVIAISNKVDEVGTIPTRAAGGSLQTPTKPSYNDNDTINYSAIKELIASEIDASYDVDTKTLTL